MLDFTRHLQAGLNSLGQLTRSPLASFMTCLIIGITLALPTALFILLKNVEQIHGHFQQTAQLTLFLKKNINESQTNHLLNSIKNKKEVLKAYSISPNEGLAELQKQAGVQSILENLADNPLPWAIVIIPDSHIKSDDIDVFAKKLKQLPEVETVQFDMLWLKRFGTLVTLAQRLILTITLFLGIAVLLIINNAIRSATEQSQKEIEVIKLIGGTDAFIRRPFLYAGMFYGLLGGLFAWQLVDILLITLQNPARNLADLYHSQFTLMGLGIQETLFLLLFSITLGFTGSWLAVSRFIKRRRIG